MFGGGRAGGGRRTGLIGSPLLGAYDAEHRLDYVGNVGTGFTTVTLRDLGALLAPLERPASPLIEPVPAAYARHAHWVRSSTGSFTGDQRLRHPSWRGL